MKKSGLIIQKSICQEAQVKFVRFSTFSKREIQSWSVCQINQSKLYDGNKPAKGGPNDLRLGVANMEFNCQTCGENRQCQGHFGHIKLIQPVFHYGFLQYIQKILKCICHRCSKLKIIKTNQQKERFRKISRMSNPQKRLRELAKLFGPIDKCQILDTDIQSISGGCGQYIPTKISIKQHKIVIQEKAINKIYEYNARMVYSILSKMSKNQAKILGFTKTQPIDLLISTLAVAPPQIRPSIQMNPQKKAQDDITITYLKIISLNNQLKNPSNQSERSLKILDIQKLIASIMVAVDRLTINSIQSNSKRRRTIHKIKSIEERLKSKEGRFRQHLMGKRVDFSARSVISPDSNISLDELGVPEKIAKSLTIPEQINQLNFDRILDLCKRGEVKFILRQKQDKKSYENFIYLSKISSSIEQIQKHLNYGTIVERYLQNGDYVLFNRQPTLHRMSMMSHRIRILPYNTFRLNLSVCSPYNADFDGDQMNMHVPQSLQSISQLKNIAYVPKQVIAPKNNSPIMGIVQDSLLGIYLMTMRDTFLTRQQIMNLIIWIQPCIKLQFGQLPQPAILKPQPLWTGKQVISLLIPQQISLEIFKASDSFRNVQDTSMIIRKGELISGALQKEVVGSGSGGLVHSIWLQIGAQATSSFITNAQRIANNWLMSCSFSCGAQDVAISQQLQIQRKKEIHSIHKEYYSIFRDYRNNETVKRQNLHQKGKKIENSFQFKINGSLNNHLSKMQKFISEKISANKNNIYKMITAKSKGSQTNLAQIIFFLGNQNVDGQRCPLGFHKRALPHFRKYDNSPQPRGFVFSSFFVGLKPHQFFFHSMGGRQGLSDTAVKTSNIGYIQRKLVKSLQDLSIRYDGTVRDSQNNILQKIYGYDGFLSEFIEKHKIKDCQIPDNQFRAKYQWKPMQLVSFEEDKLDKQKLKRQFQELKRCRTRLRQIFTRGNDERQIEYFSPIKMQRVFTKIMKNDKNIPAFKGKPASPVAIIEMVQNLINQCILPQYKKQFKQLLANHYTPEMLKHFQEDTGIQIFRIHLRLNLASKVLYNKHKFTAQQLRKLMIQIKNKFRQAIAPAGQAIGSIAAQSIGQPTTQMTLNTFHLAGVSDKNVTLGIPRLRQLLDASKKIKTPNITIYYRNKVVKENTQLISQIISFDFPEKHIKDYISKTRIFYDPDPYSSRIGFLNTIQTQKKCKTPWVISLTFDQSKITNAKNWAEIFRQIQIYFQNQFEILQKANRQDQQPQIMMRFFERSTYTKGQKPIQQHNIFNFLNICENQIKQIFVSGIKGIKSVKVSNKKNYKHISGNEDITKMQPVEEVIFQASGTNFKACLNHQKIDCQRSYSNDINQINQILGIEASRQSFLNQFRQILKPYNIYINHRHLSVLADWMTTRGALTPINRNGINRVKDVSVLRKASFEETADIMFGAATFSEVDQLKGVSERIIFGQQIKIGTNSFEVVLDNKKSEQIKYKGKKDLYEILELTQKQQQIYNISQTPKPLIETLTYDQSHNINSMRSQNLSIQWNQNSPIFGDQSEYDNNQRLLNQSLQEKPNVSIRAPNMQNFNPYNPSNQRGFLPFNPLHSPTYVPNFMHQDSLYQHSYSKTQYSSPNYNIPTTSPQYPSQKHNQYISPSYINEQSPQYPNLTSPSYKLLSNKLKNNDLLKRGEQNEGEQMQNVNEESVSPSDSPSSDSQNELKRRKFQQSKPKLTKPSQQTKQVIAKCEQQDYSDSD